ncbi:MAG TPA: hypothetical protein VF256_21955 [Streptosporangiaceae bacterium]
MAGSWPPGPGARIRPPAGMHYPTSWDLFFRGYMTLADLYHYRTKHLGFHHRQLTLNGAK